jgi:hypothetical protein
VLEVGPRWHAALLKFSPKILESGRPAITLRRSEGMAALLLDPLCLQIKAEVLTPEHPPFA